MTFRALLPSLAALVLLLAPSGPARAQDYVEINPPQPTAAGEGEVEIIEFFNFSCPACFRFQGPFNSWKRGLKPENMVLLRKPVVFERAGGLYAKLFFALEAVGKEEELFSRTFTVIHKEKRLLNSEGRILDWLEEEGLDRERMEKVFDSFAVQSKVARAVRESDSYGATSTPQMVVAGKYRLDPGVYGTYDALLDAMSELYEREGGRFAANEESGGEG